MRPFRLGCRLLLPLLLVAAGCHPTATGDPPPVVLISVDTLRADRLPVYGHGAVATPHLDRLAADGLVFDNAYSPVPLTLPAHASLFTGLAPGVHGVRDNLGYRLTAATLAERLRAAGYATAAAVSAYVLRGATGIGRGFEVYDDGIEIRGNPTLGHIERPGTATVAAARAWLAEHSARQGGAPFFLFVHLFEPHAPYEPPQPFRDRYPDPYDGEVAAADGAVGLLLEALREAGLYDGALIVLLADHGEGLGDHGEQEHGVLLYRETLRVPLLLKLPGQRHAGTHVIAPVGLLDVLPTILEAVRLPPEPALPGRSLLDVAAGRVADRRIAGETFYPRIHFGWSELRSLVDTRFHLIDGPRPELYDLTTDPGETRDLVHERRRDLALLRAELRRRVEQEEGSVEGSFAAPGRIDPEEAARLAALGYAATPTTGDGPRLHPKDGLPALARLREAYELGARGQPAEAAAVLAALVREQPAMVDARFQLALHLGTLGREVEALAQLDEAIALAPQAASGMLLEKGRLLRRRGDLEGAARHAEAVLPELPAEARELLAEVALDRGDLAAAREEARRALDAERAPRSRPVLILATVELAAGRPAAALELLTPVAARVETGELPPLPSLDYLRADALARLGRAEEAEGAFRREVERYPAHSRAWAQLAVLYATERRFERIEPTLEAMIRAHPVRATYLLAADTAQRLGDQEGALRYRRRAPQEPPP